MRNNYKIIDNIAHIQLSNRKGEKFEVLVDKDDMYKIKMHKWYPRYDTHTHSYYARATEYYIDIDGKKKCRLHFLHNFILDRQDNQIVDHINHNTLDCTRDNLRLVYPDQNSRNRKGKNSNNKSGYRNVCWLKSRHKWCVQIMVNGKNTILGLFDDVHEAGKFAKEMRQKYYGEFAGAS